MLASLLHITQSLGYPLLFVVVGIEAMGVPVPGETAVIAAGLAASQGRLSIAIVILVASAGAIVGDNVGFQIGRRGGRKVLERPGRFAEKRREFLALADPFFERHGAKAVFLGRWVAGLRIWASWLAGSSSMRWPTFLLWNALGGIGWSTSVALAAYFGGQGAVHVVTQIGIYAAVAAAVIIVAIVVAVLLRRRARRAS